ncbi:MAG: hypothetical protein K0U52_06575 [Gammaproteobacteria bacterium]|nr:hypothetical protein [Gammaproteobacteria bacterium]
MNPETPKDTPTPAPVCDNMGLIEPVPSKRRECVMRPTPIREQGYVGLPEPHPPSNAPPTPFFPGEERDHYVGIPSQQPETPRQQYPLPPVQNVDYFQQNGYNQGFICGFNNGFYVGRSVAPKHYYNRRPYQGNRPNKHHQRRPNQTVHTTPGGQDFVVKPGVNWPTPKETKKV